MGYWESLSAKSIYDSVLKTFADEADAKEAEYNRYADFRDGRPSRINQSEGKYFEKRKRETQERYDDRPKLSIPLCRLIVDVHAEALTKNIKTGFDADDDAEKKALRATEDAWAEVAERNELDAYWNRLGQTLGTFGSCVVRPVLHNDGTPTKALEFDSFTPLEAKLIYETNTAGRSVKRFYGVAIQTGYSLENGSAIPISEITPSIKKALDVKIRTEYITPKFWHVYLNNELTPESPHGDIWMPDPEGGTNPYGFVPAVLFNGLETEESFTGISDIHHSVYDVMNVNEIWSDVIYMHRMYVPTGVLETSNEKSVEAFRAGIGAGVRVNPGEDFRYANANVDFTAAMEPMTVALGMALANAKTPAMSIGMANVFPKMGTSAGNISGVSKAMEWKPTVRHAVQKQKPFARGVRQLIRNSLRIMATKPPYGQGLKVNPDAKITVDFPGEIVPVTKAEELEKMTGEILAGMRGVYGAMIDYHKWSPERAQREMDMIAVEQRRHYAEDLGMKDLVDIVMDRQSVEVTTAQKKAAEKKLFGAAPELNGDRTANAAADAKG